MYQEWDELLRRAKAGEKEIKEEILKRLRPLIIKSIQSYYNRRELYEELIQEGDLCILESIETFESDKKVYFLGYVKTQLRYLYLNKNKIKQDSSLNIMVGDQKNEELINTLASDEENQGDHMIKEELHRDLEEALKSLTERQRQIIELFYIKRKNITDISKELEVSYRTVVNTKTRALVKLREQLAD